MKPDAAYMEFITIVIRSISKGIVFGINDEPTIRCVLYEEEINELLKLVSKETQSILIDAYPIKDGMHPWTRQNYVDWFNGNRFKILDEALVKLVNDKIDSLARSHMLKLGYAPSWIEDYISYKTKFAPNYRF